ncbi:hypothetical protein L249_7306 [Ophiocordyceps polyrhachis-furcata BCC 54312]|uniref:Uncharacterized protein n=1 Tax=Ophiocordyceps polyrhachis-furcata BCC 54312 TaxID=1330021 RepID=A0A367LBN8_9HYPO|nr:hypothetical protein L249_7306 [Ophiocordyceps polyrhachis-furcata BCC 54312]
MLAISSALLASLPRSLDLRNPEDEVAALRISYEILLDILDILFSAILEGERLTFNRLEEIRLRIIETLSDTE